MFLNISKFNRLVKNAYKSKLTVADTLGGLAIVASKWGTWIENEHVPNKIKAVIMELAGELPEPDSGFEVSKSFPDPQIMDVRVLDPIISVPRNGSDKLTVTPVRLGPHQLLQFNRSKKIICVQEEQFQIIDKTAIDFEVEGEPTGPICKEDLSSAVYWHNSIGRVFMAYQPLGPKGISVLRALETIDFEKLSEEE